MKLRRRPCPRSRSRYRITGAGPPLPLPQHPLSLCRVRPVCARSPLLGLCRHLCPCLSLTQGEAHPGARQSLRGERPAGPGRGPCPRTPSGREATGRPGGHSVSALSMLTPARTHASICGSVPQRLPCTSTPHSFPTGSPAAFLRRGWWHSAAGAGPGAAHGSRLLPCKPPPARTFRGPQWEAHAACLQGGCLQEADELEDG